MANFRYLASSVKPWIPMYQLLTALRQQTSCTVCLRHSIETEFISLMPVVQQMQARMGDVHLVPAASVEEYVS